MESKKLHQVTESPKIICENAMKLYSHLPSPSFSQEFWPHFLSPKKIAGLLNDLRVDGSHAVDLDINYLPKKSVKQRRYVEFHMVSPSKNDLTIRVGMFNHQKCWFNHQTCWFVCRKCGSNHHKLGFNLRTLGFYKIFLPIIILFLIHILVLGHAIAFFRYTFYIYTFIMLPRDRWFCIYTLHRG